MRKSKRYVSEGEIPECCPKCDGELEIDHISNNDGVLYRMICNNCDYSLDIEFVSGEHINHMLDE